MSSLKKQLAALQSSAFSTKKRPSILYSEIEAADISLNDLYKNAKLAFYELCGLEHLLSPFESELFTEPNEYKSRGQFSLLESQKMGETLNNFLFYLSPYVLLPQAKSVLEYLIRRYSINEYDVDILFMILLPYHETDLFLKVLHILQLNDSIWSFLAIAKKNNTPVTRTMIAKECAKDPALFQFICEIPQKMNAKHVTYKHILTFYVAVVSETISMPKGDVETFLNTYLPYVLYGLKADSSEYQVSHYILLVQLFHAYHLTEKTVQTLSKVIVKYMNNQSLYTVLQCLIILFETQTMTSIPSKIMKLLKKQNDITSVLQLIRSKYYPSLLNHINRSSEETSKITGEQFISTLLFQLNLIQSLGSKMIFTQLNSENQFYIALDQLFLSLEKLTKIDLNDLSVIKANLHSSVVSNGTTDFSDSTVLSPLLSFLFNLIYTRGNHKNIKEIIHAFVIHFPHPLFSSNSNLKLDSPIFYIDLFQNISQIVLQKPELYLLLLSCSNMPSNTWIILVIATHLIKQNHASLLSCDLYDFYFTYFQLISSQLEVAHIAEGEFTFVQNQIVEVTKPDNDNDFLSFLFSSFCTLIETVSLSMEYDGQASLPTLITYLFSLPPNIYTAYESSIVTLLSDKLGDKTLVILNSIILTPITIATPVAQSRAFLFLLHSVQESGSISSLFPLGFISLNHSSKSIRTIGFDVLMTISNQYTSSTKTPKKGGKTPDSIRNFLTILGKNKEEIINSNQGISVFCQKIFSDNSVFSADDISIIFDSLATNLFQDNYFRISYFFHVIEKCKLFNILDNHILQLFKRILSEPFSENTVTLPDEIIFCVKNIFLYLSQSAPPSNDLFSLYLDLIKSIEEKPILASVIELLIDNITPTFYTSLKVPQRINLFQSLCLLLRHSDLIPSSIVLKTIGQLSIDEHYIESLFSELDTVTEHQQNEWLHKIITYCEIVRNHNELKFYTPLLSHFFTYLEFLLPLIVKSEQDNDVTLEYSLQVILENILNFAVQLTDKDTETTKRRKVVKDTRVFNIEILLQYLQEKVNPQSRNTILLILGSLVRGKYDKILKDLYPTLNTMIQLNLSKDVEINYHIMLQLLRMIISVIQSKNMTIEYLNLFISNYTVYPDSRRLPFLKSIISIFTVSNLYWAQLLLYMSIYNKNMNSGEKDALIVFLHQLTSNFPPLYQISNLSHLLTMSYQVVIMYNPNLKDNNSDSNDTQKIDIPQFVKENYLDKLNVTEFITDLLHFVSGHMTSDLFLQQIVGNNETETNQLENGYLQMCEILFLLIRSIANQCSLPSTGEANPFIPILNACYDIIDTINELLSIPSFIVVITELLNNSHSIVRKKALLFFNKKIESEENTMSPQEQKLFLEMTPELSKVVQSQNEEIINKQTAILSIHILAEHFASKYSDDFIQPLSTIINLIQKDLNLNNKQLIGSSYICLATLCKALGAKIFPYLSQFFPFMLKLIQNFSATEEQPLSESTLLLIQSLLSSLSSIIQYIPSFLSPYVKEILVSILKPYYILHDKIVTYVQIILKFIGQNIHIRIIYPILDDIYKTVFDYNSSHCLINLLYLLQKVIEKLTREDIVYYHTQLFNHLINFMNYRSLVNVESTIIYELEKSVISTMIVFVLKLSESQLRPLFLHLCEWVKENEHISYQRGIVFFNLVDEITNKLRSIFVPYFGYILNDMIDILNMIYEKRKSLDADNYFLLIQIIKCLYSCSLYDQDKFIDSGKFEIIRSPLLHLLEITKLPGQDPNTYNEYIQNYILPCISQLVVDVNDDVLWKPFHHELLFITRSSNPIIKISAIQAIRECFIRVGEQYLMLLPETIPYLSELLEDANPEVENESLKLKESVENLSGESIDKYLTH